jgi:hypothetical protein
MGGSTRSLLTKEVTGRTGVLLMMEGQTRVVDRAERCFLGLALPVSWMS